MAEPRNYKGSQVVPSTRPRIDQPFPDEAAGLAWLKSHLEAGGVFCEKCNSVTNFTVQSASSAPRTSTGGPHVREEAGMTLRRCPTLLTTWLESRVPVACAKGYFWGTRWNWRVASCARRHGDVWRTPFHVGKGDPIQGIEHGVEINDRGNGRREVLEKTAVKRQGRVEGFKLV
jgi:hypothetical protein